MGDRGAVHTYRPTWTQPDKADPTKRVQRTASLWHWVFYYRARRYQGGPGEATRAAARAHGEKRKAEVTAGLEQDPRKLTFLGLAQILEAEQHLKDASTRASVVAVIKRLRRFFHDADFALDLTRTRLLEFVAFRQAEGSAASTIRLDLQYLRTAMTLAHQQGRMFVVPAFPRIKVQRRAQFFRPDEVERLFGELPAWWRPFFEAALEMGWRARSELRTRTWASVDFGPELWACECGTLRDAPACQACGVGRPGWVELEAEASKTDERRVFPMTKRLREILTLQRVRVDALQIETGRLVPWVFPGPGGEQIGDYRKAWALASKRAGFGKLEGKTGPWSSSRVAHDLRRTAIRRFEMGGGNRSASMAAVGHGDERTFSGYARAGADAEAQRAWAVQLDRQRATEQPPEPKVVQLDLWKAAR